MLIAMVIILLGRRGKARPVLAGSAWFVIALLPVLGLTPFAYQALSTVADRYIYLPIFGVALVVAWGLGWLHDAISRLPIRAAWLHKTVTAGAIGLLLILAIQTHRQTRLWHDSKSLFDHTEQIIGREPGMHESGDKLPWQ